MGNNTRIRRGRFDLTQVMGMGIATARLAGASGGGAGDDASSEALIYEIRSKEEKVHAIEEVTVNHKS